MKQLKIIIERSADLFSAYAEQIEGVYGGGDTVAEAKQSIIDAIRLLKEHNSEEHIPPILKGNYELVYKFDAVSLLEYYKGIFTNAALEKLTGINQKQLQHYSSGHRNPRPAQREKIENALHKLGRELLAVEL
ncbi:MAG: type II toxin-antitoxin system HicB family antitoxin [Moraxellaceae bacterium]|nr:MAG: type II toxin-antitoxin system HicB family antitoxin [Moraxellaceae bacterium]